MTLRLPIKGTYDFYTTFDLPEYFDQEYDPEEIMEGGYARPLRLKARDVLVVAQFVEEEEGSYFELTLPDQAAPSGAEEAEILGKMSRIVGAQIDADAFVKAMAHDPVIGPMAKKHLGFRRLSLADFYEDAIRLIVRTRISHGPTKQKMVRAIREHWGTRWQWRGREYWGYPRPQVLAKVEPAELREHSLSTRKAEYIIGLAKLVSQGELDLGALEQMSPADFFQRVTQIRGIGPSSAQSLVMRRDRPDAVFPPKKGEPLGSNGMLKWMLPAYGLDPERCTDKEVERILASWRGWEAMVAHTYYYDWTMGQLEKSMGEKT